MNFYILFSHGMGLLRDNRGMFPFFEQLISQQYPDTIFHYFDYNDIDDEAKTVSVKPFSEQAKILQKEIDTVAVEAKESKVYIIGQSQGSLIPAYCDVSGIHKVIGISPFFHTKIEDIVARYSMSGENEINFNGVTKRKRTDGTTTLMPASYWQERFKTDPEALYNHMALAVKLTLICPLQDEIMDITNLTKIKNTRIINLDGGHDFLGESREVLGRCVLEELSY